MCPSARGSCVKFLTILYFFESVSIMEDFNIEEMKPAPMATEISNHELPIVDPQQHSSTELITFDPAASIEYKDTLNVENLSDPPTSCSKSQLKRMKKMQNRLEMRAEWKFQRKLRNKMRKARSKLATLSLEKPKITPMSNSTRNFTVVIDFSYDELMSPKDLIKCGNQVVRCYSANRRSSNPMQLHFCNFAGKIETELAKNNGYKKWDIHFHENNYLDVFNKSDLVYLTSESRNVLETLDENKVYIIGGLVDHNAHKGVSYRKAVHEGISHAQLPIKKYIQMKSRSVLTINHVYEILLKVSNGESWAQALKGAVPARFCETCIVSDEPADDDSMRTSDDKDEQPDDAEMDDPSEGTAPEVEEEAPKMSVNVTSTK